MEAVNKDAVAHDVQTRMCARVYACVCEWEHTHWETPQQSLDWHSSICKSMQPKEKQELYCLFTENDVEEEEEVEEKATN